MFRLGALGFASLLATTAAVMAQTPAERGQYLINSILACGNCHTPKTASGQPIAEKELLVSSLTTGRRIPGPGSDEVVQLITFAERKPPRHRLNALAIARADQPRHVQRTHPAPCLVPQSTQKRHEPTFKLVLPIRHPANHGRPLQKPTTHESQKN
jgi:hypothetical protein